MAHGTGGAPAWWKPTVFCVGLATAWTSPISGIEPARQGTQAPVRVRTVADVFGPSGLEDLQHRVWRPADLQGTIVLVDAWATWCAPCLAELPRLRALAARHAGQFRVLGLSLDTLPRRDFISWLRRHDVGWPQVFDGRGYSGRVAQRLGLEALPASWLFDANGLLVARNLRGTALEEFVDALIEDGTTR